MKPLSQLCQLLFSSEGRIGWKGYFLGWALNILLIISFYYTINSMSQTHPGYGHEAMCCLQVFLSIWLLFILPLKRLHDFGASGWPPMLTVLLVAWLTFPTPLNHFSNVIAEHSVNVLVGLIINLITIGLLPRDKSANKYGNPYTTLFPPDDKPSDR